MPVGALADADGLAVTLTWLRAHPAVLGQVGGDPGRIGPDNRPPYPRLLVVDGGSDDGDLVWTSEQSVRLEAVGDLDDTVGPQALRRMLYVAMAAVAELPDRDGLTVTDTIVSRVRASGGAAFAPLGGQRRYVATLQMSVHPPLQVPD